MKKKVGIIGFGKWAKKIIPIINDISIINFIINSKTDYRNIKSEVDWIFVLTSNQTHYKIVKYFLNLRKNVFCEKPLSLSYKKSLELFQLAKKNKKKLYVSDVEFYKKKSLQINKINNIIRCKYDKKGGDILNRLSYHDFYLLYKNIKLAKKTQITILKNESKNLKFNIYNDGKIYHFYYSLNSLNKKHMINNKNFLNFEEDPLKTMLKKVLYGNINVIKNKNSSLFASKIIEMINKNGNS